MCMPPRFWLLAWIRPERTNNQSKGCSHSVSHLEEWGSTGNLTKLPVFRWLQVLFQTYKACLGPARPPVECSLFLFSPPPGSAAASPEAWPQGTWCCRELPEGSSAPQMCVDKFWLFRGSLYKSQTWFQRRPCWSEDLLTVKHRHIVSRHCDHSQSLFTGNRNKYLLTVLRQIPDTRVFTNFPQIFYVLFLPTSILTLSHICFPFHSFSLPVLKLQLMCVFFVCLFVSCFQSIKERRL